MACRRRSGARSSDVGRLWAGTQRTPGPFNRWAFCQARLGEDPGEAFGTLDAQAPVARLIERALPALEVRPPA